MNPRKVAISTLALALCLSLAGFLIPVASVDATADLLQLNDERKQSVALIEELTAGDPKVTLERIEKLRSLGGRWPHRVDFLLARHYVAQGRYGSAVGLLERIPAEYSLVGDYVLLTLARAYAGIGERQRTIAILERLLANYPRSSAAQEAGLLKARTHLDNEDASRAIETLDRIEAPEGYLPQENRTRFLRAEALRKTGKREEAVAILKNIYKSVPDTPDAEESLEQLILLDANRFSFEERLERAHVLKQQRKYERASRVYEALLQESPDDPEIMEALGRALFGARKYDSAAVILKQVDSADTRFLKTRALYRAGKISEFLESLKQAQRDHPSLKPRFYRLRLAIGQDARRSGGFEEARSQLSALLEAYPENRLQTLWEIGWTEYAAKNFEAAARSFSELAEASPENYRAAYWKARTLGRLDRHSEMTETLRALHENRSAGYYGYLASALLPDASVVRVSWKPPRTPPPARFDRAAELRVLGLDDEARREIPWLASESRGIEDALLLATFAALLDDYRTAIRLSLPLSRLRPDFNHLAYPFGYRHLLEKTAADEQIDPFLVAAVIREESKFNPRAYSRAGAMGLMQLMPGTARRMGTLAQVELGDEGDLFLPEKNVPIGTHYLSRLVRNFDGNIVFAIAAYNAGETAVERWIRRAGTLPLDRFVEEISYPETRNYVKKVLASYMEYQRLWGLTPPSLSGIVNPGEPREF